LRLHRCLLHINVESLIFLFDEKVRESGDEEENGHHAVDVRCWHIPGRKESKDVVREEGKREEKREGGGRVVEEDGWMDGIDG